jgi:hypothetical protein
MRLRDGYDRVTESDFAEISQNVWGTPWQWLGKSSGKKAWAVHGMSKLPETEKRCDRRKAKIKSMFITFFDIKEIVHKEFVLEG